jgi:hypothetical protein
MAAKLRGHERMAGLVDAQQVSIGLGADNHGG